MQIFNKIFKFRLIINKKNKNSSMQINAIKLNNLSFFNEILNINIHDFLSLKALSLQNIIIFINFVDKIDIILRFLPKILEFPTRLSTIIK